MPDTDIKQCSKCEQVKPLTKFVKQSSSKDGCQPFCRACQRAYQRAYRAKPGKLKHANLLANYGITLEAYEALIAGQGGNCPICTSPLNVEKPREVHLDHCHKTGDIRGVLCRGCNMGLGHLKDDLENLQRAIAYLKAN